MTNPSTNPNPTGGQTRKGLASTCAQCGKPYIAQRSTSQYCTTLCRVTAHRTSHRASQNRKAKPPPRTCDQCGQTYQPKRSTSRYCRDACRQKTYRQNK